MTKRARSFATLALLLSWITLTSGCFGEDPEQMLETAKFEEVQRNHAHATEIYERILADFPDSPQAAEARARLAALAADAETE